MAAHYESNAQPEYRTEKIHLIGLVILHDLTDLVRCLGKLSIAPVLFLVVLFEQLLRCVGLVGDALEFNVFQILQSKIAVFVCLMREN